MTYQVINNKGDELNLPAFHPGEFLLEEIEERNILKKDAANALHILPHHLSEIFAGKRNISARLAIRLENYLNISAEYWLGLQSSYDLQEARELEHA